MASLALVTGTKDSGKYIVDRSTRIQVSEWSTELKENCVD